MRSNFWQGLFWGGMVGTALGLFIKPMVDRPAGKPLADYKANDVVAKTRNFMREARRSRKKLLRRVD